MAFLLTEVQGIGPQDSPRDLPIYYSITILSPSNSTYKSNFLILNITTQILFEPSTINITMVYSIDGKDNGTIPVKEIPENRPVEITYRNGKTETIQGEPPFVPARIGGWVTLPQLAEGTHHITVYAKYQYNNGGSDFIGLDSNTVYFTIDDGAPPIITCLSPENKTYSNNNLPLNFTVDEPTSWIGYSLDGQANVTITENFTLTELPSGSHKLIICANDTVGNMGKSETINFSIATPFPTTMAFSGMSTLGIVCIVLGIYFKKRKRFSEPSV